MTPPPVKAAGVTWTARIAARRRRKAWLQEKKAFAIPAAELQLTFDQLQSRRQLIDRWDFLEDPSSMRRRVALETPETAELFQQLAGQEYRAREKEKDAARALHFLISQRQELKPWRLIEKARLKRDIKLEEEKKVEAAAERAWIRDAEAAALASVDGDKLERYRWAKEEKREKEKKELLAREVREKVEEEERQKKRQEQAIRPSSTRQKKSRYSGPTGG